MKLILVDPWGKDGLNEYMDTFIQSLPKNNSIVVLTNYYSTIKELDGVIIKRIFFKFSENIKDSYWRTLIRGFEYFSTLLILVFLSQKRNTIIHFQWFLIPFLDYLFVYILKLFNCKIYYTSHNSKPHNKPKNSIFMIKIFYLLDKIFVHGNNIKKEILGYCENLEPHKILVIPHGLKEININWVDQIPKEINYNQINDNLLFSFVGIINENKGILNLIDIWKDVSENLNNVNLLIAGKVDVTIKGQLNDVQLKNCQIIDRFLNENEMSWIFNNSQLILLPYINGSVSGVFFSSASFKKPVLSTNFGSIDDYIINDKTSFIAEDLHDFKNKIINLSSKKKTYFDDIGKKNHAFIEANCSVDILNNLLRDEYK